MLLLKVMYIKLLWWSVQILGTLRVEGLRGVVDPVTEFALECGITQTSVIMTLQSPYFLSYAL